jgi:pyruvate/oxaloacetate carboxyltransferase
MANASGKKVGIDSVDFRDAQQSLYATRFKTEDMIPILEKVDRVGYGSVEMWGGATFDACIRYLKEDPWERLRSFKKKLPSTKLKMLMRGQNCVGYRQYPDDVVEKFVEKTSDNGMDIFVIFDSLNDLRNCETAIKAVRKNGRIPEGSIIYTISPVHTFEMYIDLAKRFEDMGVEAVQLTDSAGILSPIMAYKLVRRLKREVKLPIHLHCHCVGGMASMSYFAAVSAGVNSLDTAISAMSLGASLPPTESIVIGLRGSKYDPDLNLGILAEINNFFLELGDKYTHYKTKYTGIDVTVLRHQIPGGMLSNLEEQLKEQNAAEKISQILEEVQRVRKDLGYPPLVTPSSQIVGAQATLNVILGKRYKILNKETSDFVKGMYGHPPGPLSEELLNKILEKEQKILGRPADLLEPELDKIRRKLGNWTEDDETVLTYALFPQVAEEFFARKTPERGD